VNRRDNRHGMSRNDECAILYEDIYSINSNLIKVIFSDKSDRLCVCYTGTNVISNQLKIRRRDR
jgi:hypothetical protein